jgi:hypothetical protein
MYSHDDKFIYVHIPKSAGTFIKHYLLSNIEEDYKSNQNQQDYDSQYRTTCERALNAVVNEVPDWREYFKFTIVRNPFDRVVSMFAYIGGWKYDYFIKNNINSPVMEHVEAFRRFYLNDDFDGFLVEAYENERIRKFHIGYYDNYVDRLTVHGKVAIDKFYKMEEMDSCLKDLQQRFGFSSDKAFNDWRQNSSAEYRKRCHYSKYYSDFAKDLVSDHFKRDLEFFGYEF